MSDLPLHWIAGRFFNRPLLLAPDAGANIAGFLAGRMRTGGRGGGGSERSAETVEFFRARENPDGTMEAHSPRVSRFCGSTPIGADGRPLPFRRTENGVAIISIIGELVNRGAYIGASSGLVSYEGIRHQLRSAAADPQSRAIILDLESPGGEAVGAFEVAAAVREAAAIKPVVAVVDGLAASGGYAIASGATRIVTIPTGQVGSVGVLWVHYDFSAALDAEGVVPTILFAGAHKVDGHPFAPLPDDVRAARQASIDGFYQQFLACVAKGRGGRLTADAARRTEAKIFTGAEAVRVGLADAVGTIEDVLADLAPGGRRLASPSSSNVIANGSTPPMSTVATPQITADTAATEPETDVVTDVLAQAPIVGPLEALAPNFGLPADAAAAVRQQAADLVDVAQRAREMGVAVDVGAALTAGMSPAALKLAVHEEMVRRSEASRIVGTPPPVGQSGGGLLAAARRQAAASRKEPAR